MGKKAHSMAHWPGLSPAIRLLLCLLFFWTSGDVGASHRPRALVYCTCPGPSYQAEVNPKIFSTYYPSKLWNIDYAKAQMEHQRKLLEQQQQQQQPKPFNPSLYFNPFKFPDYGASSSGNSQDNNEDGNSLSPRVLTPYIGARALSNMEKFFEDLQENVEILREQYTQGKNGRSSGVKSRFNSFGSSLGRSNEMQESSSPALSYGGSIRDPFIQEKWKNPAASFFRGKHRLTPVRAESSFV